MSKLESKVAVITGGAQGIGYGIAKAFAREGASLVVAGRTQSRLDQAADVLRAAPYDAKVLPLAVDISTTAGVEQTVERTLAEFGQLDILVNNAVGGTDTKPFAETTDEYMQEALDINLFGAFRLMKCAYPHLKQAKGRVINMVSGYGTEGWANQVAYVATKEAIRAMTVCSAREWGPEGINVNAIAPFAMSDAMTNYREVNPEEFDALQQTVPLRYIGDPETDVGPVAVFLASADGRYITGRTIMADGGLFGFR